MRDNLELMFEIWKCIAGYPGYEASDAGRVRSLKRGRVRILKQHDCKGYMRVVICMSGKMATPMVHRLVCIAFNGAPPSPEHETAHEDGTRRNNVPSNLSWKTHKDNLLDRIRHGTDPSGRRNGRSVLTDDAVAQIRVEYRRGTGRANRGNGAEMAARFGVDPSTIRAAAKGATWSHA